MEISCRGSNFVQSDFKCFNYFLASGNLRLCKQFGLRLATLIVFVKDLFEKGTFEEKKRSADDNKSIKNYPACK